MVIITGALMVLVIFTSYYCGRWVSQGFMFTRAGCVGPMLFPESFPGQSQYEIQNLNMWFLRLGMTETVLYLVAMWIISLISYAFAIYYPKWEWVKETATMYWLLIIVGAIAAPAIPFYGFGDRVILWMGDEIGLGFVSWIFYAILVIAGLIRLRKFPVS